VTLDDEEDVFDYLKAYTPRWKRNK
jgi:hypothetical protein